MDILVEGLCGSLHCSHVNEDCWIITLKDTSEPGEPLAYGQHRYVKILTLEAELENGLTIALVFHCMLINIGSLKKLSDFG